MRGVTDTLRRHWPEYVMEAAGLGSFMLSACTVVALLEYPGSPAHGLLPDPTARRVLIGLAMGLTAIGIIYSPWGQQSGAHLNPAVTLTFFRLGKIGGADTTFYVGAQFTGGLGGVVLASVLIGPPIGDISVNYAVTTPGPGGTMIAFLAEVLISFLLMLVVLTVSNTRSLARYTGLFAGVLVASYIAIEAPFSGMSMNPARTVASAVPAHLYTALWIYFAAPTIGMLSAAELYLRLKGHRRVYCAKLNHANDKRCIFRCRYDELLASDHQ